MTSSIRTRVHRLEQNRPSGRDAFRKSIEVIPPEITDRIALLMLMNDVKGLTTEEHAELSALLVEQVNLELPMESHLAGLTGFSDSLQQRINRAAERWTEFREYAAERTWVGDFYSPRHCAHWWVEVEKSSLPPDIREKTILLLKPRETNCKLASAAVDWLCGVLENSGLDLGPEGQQPWLRQHLEDGRVPYEPPAAKNEKRVC